MKKVLVTGADGFIGSHLTESLLEKGYDVKAFVYYNSFNNWGWLDTLPKEKLDQIEIFAGDVRDPNGVRTAMKGVDQVFHLAALIAIPFSYHSPDSYVDTNIKGTLNVLQAARDLGTEKIMVTSTSEVYGTAQYVPIDEKHPFQGQSPYSATKIGADRLAESFYRSFNLPVAIVRPFNTYGPRQSARAVIPTIIAESMEASDYYCGLSVGLLLFILAIGVNLLVRVGMVKSSYDTLLQEGEYTKEEKLFKKKTDTFSGVYWCLTTAIYLAWSFWTMSWDITWIVWPVAGVLFAALLGVVKMVLKNGSETQHYI